MKKVIERMGQAEAKQKLQLMTNSLAKIRRDIKNGKITANDIERIEEILQRYSFELDVQLSKKLRAADVYNVEQTIDITRKELNSLQRESNLDLAAVSTNSFRRAPSKNISKEKNKNVKSILTSVEEIRTQVRTGKLKQEDYDRLQGFLAGYSQQLSYIAKKSRKQEVDAAQRLVSSVTAELFNKQDIAKVDENPPSASSTLTKTKTEKPVIKRQETPKLANRNNSGSLDDIESKFEALQNDVKVAESNKDRNRLRFLAKSIQTLMTDLQMIIVQNSVVNEERKAVLEKNLIRTHQQIDRIKRQISTENNINSTTELHKREKYAKELDDIETVIVTINSSLNYQNYQDEKRKFLQCKSKLQAVEELTDDIRTKKEQIAGAISNLQKVFITIEAEDKLNQVEWKHCQSRIDLDQFTDTKDGDVYKKNYQYLTQLRDEIQQIPEFNQKIDEKKKYVLYNVENNLRAFDQKAEENKRSTEEESVTLRRPLATNGQSLTETLATWRKELDQSASVGTRLQELKQLLQELSYTKNIIEQKINTENLTQLAPASSNVQNVFVFEETAENIPQLVTVRSKQLSPVINTLPPIRTQLENIQKEIQTMQAHIESSRFLKDSQLYKDIKQKIEYYKNEVISMSRSGGESGKFGDNLVRYIDNVLAMLENNLIVRKSTTTEDILVDIMSVSTRVADLGSKIQGFNSTIQDYKSIKNSLLEHQAYLKNLKISSTRPNLSKSRDDTLQQIKQYLLALDTLKKNEDITVAPEEEKKFNQQLRKLKEKVARYSGTYKNVLYKTIESDLNKCLNNVDKVYKDQNIALKVKQDIENSKIILEQKSSKDRSYDSLKRNAYDKTTKELAEIKENISSVERELNQKNQLSRAILDKLDARLTLSIVGLDNIKDEKFTSEKEKLYTEIHYHFARIQEMMVTTRPKSDLTDPALLNQFDQQQAAAEVLSSVERQLEIVKPQILLFVGAETSQKFFELDEILVRGTLKLDDLALDQTSGLFNLKMKLMREIHKYSDILDERVNQTEEVEKYEKEVRVMLIKIDSFNGYVGDAEYADLDEQIIKLKVNLGKLNVNQDLIARRDACIKEVDSCMKKLKEAAKTPTAGKGTLV